RATARTHRWVVTWPDSQPGGAGAAGHAGRPAIAGPGSTWPMSRRLTGRAPVRTDRLVGHTFPMPMRKFPHTVTDEDTSARIGSGDLEVLATPRLITWCENAAFQVCKQRIDPDHTTVGTMVKIEHVRGSAVGAQITVLCAEPINDGRRLVCHVTVTDAD